jgi:aspartate aminotransferase
MAEKYGAENVYDFSLGNPATPPPALVNRSICDITESMDTMQLHGYMSNSGYPEVRQAIADNLNKRFGTKFDFHNIVMTVGAAGGINIVFKTILDPGDEVIVFAPFFGEYRQYAANFDANVVAVQPDPDTFWPDLSDFASKITARTKAVIVNTPNNPTGVIYSPDTMREIASILGAKQDEIGHDIYLVSDEPYRELVYDGHEVDFLTKYYDNTIVGYSFSKSLSLPGERIGYVAVPNEASDCEKLLSGIEISNRTLGFVNAPSLMQQVVARCLDEKTDVAFYDNNRKVLYEGLTSLGFTCVRPEGAFYLWLKSPVANEEEFVAAGKNHRIIMVKGSAFGYPGYVRLAYCVSPETIKNSLNAFADLAKEYFA